VRRPGLPVGGPVLAFGLSDAPPFARGYVSMALAPGK
jgi:hypothetical protein